MKWRTPFFQAAHPPILRRAPAKFSVVTFIEQQSSKEFQKKLGGNFGCKSGMFIEKSEIYY